MRKFEKRLSIFALIFVGIYIGAAALTIRARVSPQEQIQRIESPELTPSEGRLMMVQLFLPMIIVLTLTICFVIVRKQRAKKIQRLEEDAGKESSP